MKIHPVNDQIVIEQIRPSNITKGNIHLPEKRHVENELENRVLAVGPGRFGFTDQRLPMPCKSGDIILAHRNNGVPYTVDGKELRIITSDNVLAVVEG